MNWDRIEGNWKQLTGSLRNSYGIATDEAENQIKDFEATVERNKWVQ